MLDKGMNLWDVAREEMSGKRRAGRVERAGRFTHLNRCFRVQMVQNLMGIWIQPTLQRKESTSEWDVRDWTEAHGRRKEACYVVVSLDSSASA